MIKIAFTLALLLAATWAAAQGPPPIPPLIAPPAPAGNPVTTEKANLGKVLFWDEQLSSTRTVSCGSCHQPASGGSDGLIRMWELPSLDPGSTVSGLFHERMFMGHRLGDGMVSRYGVTDLAFTEDHLFASGTGGFVYALPKQWQ